MAGPAKASATGAPETGGGIDVAARRAEFPILTQRPHGEPLVYLDNAATTQKPEVVIEAISRYYREDNANIHRGVHWLSQKATAGYEGTRKKVAKFINAAMPEEIIFLRGTTEAVNLVANSYGRKALRPGDEILVTELEHHSNIVPWQMLCEATGATLKVAPVDEDGAVPLQGFRAALGDRTKIAAFAHVSNALGTINPVREMIEAAHAVGAITVIDGAQAIAHTPVDVRALDADFYAFSAHKMYGPTGTGALYGKRKILEAMNPYQGGGEMIASVTFEKTTYNEVPHRFEAGTPNIAGVYGLGAAIDYIESIGLDRIARHEHELLEYATERLRALERITIFGTSREKAGILSFNIGEIHPHDAGTLLDLKGVAVRTGHHCAQPVMEHFGVTATVRASFAVFNSREDIDALVRGIEHVQAALG